MFGSFRFVLALLVVASHLVGGESAAHFGTYAVRAFFILSGFVMTAALNESYRFDSMSFVISRFLRLAPGYYAVCLLTAVIIACLPADAGAFMGRWAAHPDLSQIIANVTILLLAYDPIPFRFIEPAWSLSIEIMMYGVLWAAVARNRYCAIVGLIAGALYHVCMLQFHHSFSSRFFTPQSALLSFSIGAVLYFELSARARIKPQTANALLWGGGGAGVALLTLVYLYWSGYFDHRVGYYINTICCTAVVAGLSAMRWSGRLARLDWLLGELAYPVFLVQWVGGFLAHEMFWPDMQRGWPLYLTAVPIILLLAAPLAAMQIRLIEPLRRLTKRYTVRKHPSHGTTEVEWAGERRAVASVT
jgi:peptidoglycan/LPS O-acetylase OafA/YrhL